MNSQYLINYIAYDFSNIIVKQGTMKVKNCFNELHAKMKLEKYLKSKYPIIENITMSNNNDNHIMQQLKDIFNGKL